MSYNVIDSMGRTLISVSDDGRIAVSRFTGMDDCTIEYVAETYSDLTGDDVEGVKSFLNFESDTDQYCS